MIVSTYLLHLSYTLLLLMCAFQVNGQQQTGEVSLFPPDMWHHHVQNPYHTYYNGYHHNGGQVLDHRNDRVRASYGHFHTCHGWTCHSDIDDNSNSE
ncbi:hypothetical protein L3Y34_014514 [Caenorhabditis briggsae]|uniref:Secreted protein n=1 Tax=Caenorhabditis briggsae TaxID=6238 RepID=A0AAE9IYD9_CAEBR|nr:hypothetical protein L3Y34_014514 [Caenorhabditis briggsae]